ncbi:hypothetical protein J2S36_000936 [Arcanobacterium hippocoleae]|uniref:Uncharacterized protein n=1 Tax=Arcanobacterium hippocoleae TaxID=149017 RepID=A0ABU1T217_9ACTO|nr:hypothetical protein [Arcanobacterium hippocoleae]
MVRRISIAVIVALMLLLEIPKVLSPNRIEDSPPSTTELYERFFEPDTNLAMNLFICKLISSMPFCGNN